MPLPTFYGKKVTKCHIKWLQDIEIFAYLPIFYLKNVIFRTSELQLHHTYYLSDLMFYSLGQVLLVD